MLTYVEWWLSGRVLDLQFTGRGFNPGQSAYTQHRLIQPCIPPGSLNRVPASAGGKGGILTSVGWQVTLCDSIWHVSFSQRCGRVTANCYTLTLLLNLTINSIHQRFTGWEISFCANILIYFAQFNFQFKNTSSTKLTLQLPLLPTAASMTNCSINAPSLDFWSWYFYSPAAFPVLQPAVSKYQDQYKYNIIFAGRALRNVQERRKISTL